MRSFFYPNCRGSALFLQQPETISRLPMGDIAAALKILEVPDP